MSFRLASFISCTALVTLASTGCDDAAGTGGSGTSNDAAATASGAKAAGATTSTQGTGAGPSTSTGTGTPIEPSSCTDTACAFPGAEGFGTDTPGGRGGRVIAVTTLAGDGPGSFREALTATGPRIVVFRVSGVIDLGGDIELDETHSFVTVAGQTSPGGVTIRGGTISVYHTHLHDAVFRFLRFRGPIYDTISFNEASRIVIDHCDFAAGTDETLDITNSHDFTVQWSTITNSVSGEGSQNYGVLFGYEPTSNVTYHHNLNAHHGGRCLAEVHFAPGAEPQPGGPNLDLRNNVLYNCGFQAGVYSGFPSSAGPTHWNLVGNHALSGPNTPAESYFWGVGGEIYETDNLYPGQTVLSPFFSGTRMDVAFDFPAVTTSSAEQALVDVLAFAGAWPRDPMIVRTVAEVESGTGTLGKVDDAFIEDGPPPPSDGDADGMPDDWESANGLDPANPADGPMIDASGYSQVERYLDERARSLVGQ